MSLLGHLTFQQKAKTFMSLRHSVLVVLTLLLAAAPASAAKQPRRVEVRVDITLEGQAALEIWINCVHPADQDKNKDNFKSLTTCAADQPGRPPHQILRGPDAFAFVFSDKDRVAFVLLYQSDTQAERRGEIVHTVSGTGLSDKDIEAFKKIVGAAGGPMIAGAGRGAAPLSTANAAEVQALTDDMDIGQKITATFALKETTKDAEGKPVEKTTATRGPFVFPVGGAPRFKLSYGIAFSTAPDPTVVIEKTTNVVSFENDGKTQEAYQQVVRLRDADPQFDVIEALVTMANFRIAGNFYGSAGLQINQKIFEEPMLGGTYRHTVGSKMAVNLTVRSAAQPRDLHPGGQRVHGRVPDRPDPTGHGG